MPMDLTGQQSGSLASLGGAPWLKVGFPLTY